MATRVTVKIFLANPLHPGPEAERAWRHAEAAVRRYADRVNLELIALDDPAATALGIGVEPTVLVGDLVVAVGMAPPAGHLVRAIEAALTKEDSDE